MAAPNYIGIGAPKSATTWVAKIIEAHPEAALAKGKELNFFNDHYVPFAKSSDRINLLNKKYRKQYNKNLKTYERLLPEDGEKIVGEYSVTYLYSQKAARRIRRNYPDIKILVTLRNPAEMVYSLYQWFNSSMLLSIPNDFGVFIESEPNFLEFGFYHKYLSTYYELFPPQNIFVIIRKDIHETPRRVTRSLYDFLNVDSNYQPEIVHEMVGGFIKFKYPFFKKGLKIVYDNIAVNNFFYSTAFKIFHRNFQESYANFFYEKSNYPPLDEKVRKSLTKHYRADILKLEKLIDKDLSAWLEQ